MRPRTRGRILQIGRAGLCFLAAGILFRWMGVLGDACAAEGQSCHTVLPALVVASSLLGLGFLIEALAPANSQGGGS